MAADKSRLNTKSGTDIAILVGKVLVAGTDMCLQQVKAGCAWHDKKYQHEQSPEDQRLYANAENKAGDERLGLWRENSPIPPWEFRRLYK